MKSTERNETLAILNEVANFEAAGVPFTKACRLAGAKGPTVLRLRERYRFAGMVGVQPGKSSGRPDYAALLDDRAIERIRELALKTDSIALAYDLFRGDPLCPEEIRAALEGLKSRQSIPMSLRRVATLPPEIKRLYRGDKNHALNGFRQLRDMTEIMPDGSRRQIVPGDWWEMDDMSLNHPFWYACDCPVCGANGERDGEYRKPGSGCSKLAHRWGVEVGRQSLWALDVASCKWLGFEMVGRPRDAYRAEDILRFCRKLFETYGMPRRGLRLERGAWMSKRVKGCDLKAALREDPDYAAVLVDSEMGEMAETERKVVVGGLAQLGIEVVYCWSPHAKGMIESSFDHLQSIAATIGDR